MPLAALALLLLSLPAALAVQDVEATGPTRVLEDAAGDAGIDTPAMALPGSPRQQYLDIVSLDVEELADVFALRLGLAGEPPEREAPLADALTHHVGFSYGGVAYLVRIEHGVALAGSRDEATLLADPAGGQSYSAVQDVPVARDGAVTTVSVPRLLLVDAAGAPAFAGQSLVGFWAASSAVRVLASAEEPHAQDRAPDAGTSPVPVAVRFGVRQDGDLRLSSPQPFRASNGEAATFRFPVTVANLGGASARATLAATALPTGWQVEVPGPVEVPAGGAVDLEVAAVVPFAHQHGDFSTFTLEARAGDEVGRAVLGLLYVSPPQPAGHHDTLFLHTRQGLVLHPAVDVALGSLSGGVDAYWNTLEEDPADEGLLLPPDFTGLVGVEETQYAWSVPLSPALALGLDAALERTGAASLPVASTLPADDATLEVSVLVADALGANESWPDPATATVMAASAPTSVRLEANAVTVLEAALVPDAAGDYVTHKPGQQLWLRVQLTLPRADVMGGPATPMLAPGGWVRLPLNEYSDRAAFASAPEAQGEQEPSQADSKESPAGAWGLLAVGLAGAAAMRRRA